MNRIKKAILKMLIPAAVMSVTPGPGVTAAGEDLGGCVQHGQQTGELFAQQFCNIWEAKYHGTTEPHSYFAVPPRICELAMAIACRQHMAAWVSANRGLCRDIVRSDWQGARSSWSEVQLTGCPFNPAPEIYCPAGATVFSERFCHMSNGEYRGWVFGNWHVYVASEQRADGSYAYAMRSLNSGEIRSVLWDDLTPVREPI